MLTHESTVTAAPHRPLTELHPNGASAPVVDPDAFAEEALSEYGQYVNSAMARLYRFMGFRTVEWQARGAVITDVHGQDYIDCGGYGVFIHGHNHPRVVAAVAEQLSRMALAGRTLPPALPGRLGRRLAEIAPEGLSYSFFCNSGAEAVEGALKLARAYTGRKGFAATQGAFHGKTFGALSASGRKLYKDPFEPLVPGFKHVPYGDAAAMAEVVNTDDTAAIIVEPIQGEGGVIIPPAGYLRELRRIADRHGALLIFDEVQTGLGRTGRMWGADHEGVVPDILCTAKALGGGVMPIGAFTARPEIFGVFDENPYIHSSTFGANPLACAAAIAAIETLIEERLPEQAADKGAIIARGLGELQAEFPEVIREVRARGLLIGLDLGHEGLSGHFISALMERHIIVIHSLNQPCVIRLSPPAVITASQIDEVLSGLREAARTARELAGELE